MTPKQRRGRVAAALAACAVLVLSACGTTSENSGNSGGKNQKCQGPDNDYTIGMSQANVAEPYRERMDDDIRKAAKDVSQFDVNFADAEADNSKQVEQVENFITQQVDLLMISPNEATPLTSVVKKAYDQGIPVIVLDRKVDGKSYTTWIGADNTDIGEQAGKYISKELLPDGGNVLEIKGLAGSTPAKERHQGFKKGIAGSDVEVAASANGDWLRNKGRQKADSLLKANPDVNVIYSHNDPMGEGAHIAAQNAKRNDVKIVGIDGLPVKSGGLKAVEAGRLSATFVYPTGGEEAVAAAKKLLIDCEDVPKEQTLSTQRVTKDNAEETYEKLNEGK